MKIRFKHFAKGLKIRGNDLTPIGVTRQAPGASVLDLAFTKAEQWVSKDLLKKKMRPSNAFVGKIEDGEPFPLHSGTTLKQRRITRPGVPNTGWETVSDNLDATNTHLFRPDIIHHGSEDFTFSLVTKALQTAPISLAALAHRAMPEDEIASIQENLQTIALYVHEQFRRSRYHFYCGNKMMAELPLVGGVVPDSVIGQETDIKNNGWVFERRANGEVDEDHVRVCVTNANINRLAELSLDMLDIATGRLAYEGEPYMGNTMLFDTLVAEPRMYKRLAAEENQLMDQAASRTESYNMIDLSQTYGTEHVIRNYAVRHDAHALRFYPDVAFNTALLAGGGYAFDANDPNSWPRFVRVYPYYEVRSSGGSSLIGGGTKWEINPAFIRAPFGISTLFNKRIMKVMSCPDLQGVGGATISSEFGGLGYDGTAKWMNFVDRTHNPLGEIGHWLLRFKIAAQPQYTEEGYSFFHRINGRVNLNGNALALPTNASYADVTPYCTTQLGTENLGGPATTVQIEA